MRDRRLKASLHAFPIFSSYIYIYTYIEIFFRRRGKVELVEKVKSGPVANSSICHGENLESRGCARNASDGF